MSDHHDVDCTTPFSTNTNREVERKFLVLKPPADLEGRKKRSLTQGYLVITDEGEELRLRRSDESFYQTFKAGRGLERVEAEIELSREQFEVLWPATEGRRIVKDRYELDHGGFVIELDVYQGALAGLVIAEVEFDSREQSQHFDPPAWLGAEVTDDDRYKNRSLAVHGAPRQREASASGRDRFARRQSKSE
jgi:CYTH domain-containing protein